MTLKTFITVFALFLTINTNTYSAWKTIECLQKCNNETCRNKSQKESCRSNCDNDRIKACLDTEEDVSQSLHSSSRISGAYARKSEDNLSPIAPKTEDAATKVDSVVQGGVNMGAQSAQVGVQAVPNANRVSKPLPKLLPRKQGPTSSSSTSNPSEVTAKADSVIHGTVHIGKQGPQEGVQQPPVKGFVSKERCDHCGSALCGKDMKLLGDCRICGTTNEKFDKCLKLASDAGFLKMRQEGVEKSMAQNQADSLLISRKKVANLLLMTESLAPLLQMVKTRKMKDEQKANLDHFTSVLKKEASRIEEPKTPTSSKVTITATANELLSGWKTGLFGVRALVCQQIINESKQAQKSIGENLKNKIKSVVQSKSKAEAGRERQDSIETAIAKLQKLCDEGRGLAQQDINTNIQDIRHNLEEMKYIATALSDNSNKKK